MRHLVVGSIPLCILFVLLWSSGLIGSKYGLEYAGTLTLLMWRYVIVILTLIFLVSVLHRWQRISIDEFLSHILVGVLSHGVFLSACLIALDLDVSAGLVAFMLALQPMITAVISPAITGEKTTFHQWLGLCLGLFAVLIVVNDRLSLGGSLLGYGLCVLSTLAISVGNLINRRIEIDSQTLTRPKTPILMILLIQCLGALWFLFPLAGFFEGYKAVWEPSFIFSITFLAWAVTLGGYGLMFLLLRHMSATKVSSLIYLSPPSTMLIAFFSFGEQLGTIDLIGLTIAGAAVFIVTKPTQLGDKVTYANHPSGVSAFKGI